MRSIILGLAMVAASCAPAIEDAKAEQTRLPLATSPIQRCMNLGNALDSPRKEGEWGYTVRRSDMELLKDEGFDTVRLPIRWSTRMGSAPPYAIDAGFLARVDEIVRWAGEIGLNIIVNVHHYEELSERPDIHERRLEALWDQLAHHYATAPKFVIFETINEPYGAMTVKRTSALNKRLLDRIRQDNPDRWVILGTANWGNLDGLTKSSPPYDPRAILTYHDYSPFEFTHQGAFWAEPVRPTGVRWGSRKDIANMASDLDKALSAQNRFGMPVFVGEFGVYEEVPIAQRALWTRAMREGLESRGMGWCHWDFATTLKAYDQSTETWLPEIKAALLE